MSADFATCGPGSKVVANHHYRRKTYHLGLSLLLFILKMRTLLFYFALKNSLGQRQCFLCYLKCMQEQGRSGYSHFQPQVAEFWGGGQSSSLAFV